MSDKKLLSPDKVANYFGVERATVYRWIKQGKIKAIKVGRRNLRIDPESVEAFKVGSAVSVDAKKSHIPLDVIS